MVDKGQGARQLTPRPDQPRELVLTGEPQSAREAREFAREYVMQSEPTASEDYVDAIVLVTSELVTNSIRYGTEPGDSLALKLHTCHGRTRVEVRDPVRRRPQLRPESHKRDRGRGLVILDGLCHWGVDDVAFGKIVWAEVIAK
ncbi:ATP-binding protein [Streptomyces xiaopingdaonensis]|uniref:ATP-binding protein n=1 Tax=Streptomyces xiaopingdaonensis TaxID=1565415 RepID=UPI0002D776E2|nr:ATP-binding protein [Streptomyces xiaopingdaonensis]